MKKENLINLVLVLLTIYLVYQLIPETLRMFNLITAIFFPVIFSFILSYLFAPLTNILEKKLNSRKYAVSIIAVGLLLIVLFLLTKIFPLVIDETSRLIENAPKLLDNSDEWITKITDEYSFLSKEKLLEISNVENITNNILNFLYTFLTVAVKSFFSSLANVFLIPTLFIYILYDYNKIKDKVKYYLIRNNKMRTKKYLSTLNKALGKYIRGLLTIMLILTVISTVIYFIVGLDYYLVLGILFGITNMIPIFGAYIGGFFSVIYALTYSFNKALLILIVIIFLQIFEGTILTPKIQSKTLDTHPLMIIISILVFGEIFGFVGMLLAVPLLILIKVTYKFYIKNDF